MRNLGVIQPWDPILGAMRAVACQSASRKIVVISGWVERGDEKEAFLAGGWERGRETAGPRSKGRSWGRSGGGRE